MWDDTGYIQSENKLRIAVKCEACGIRTRNRVIAMYSMIIPFTKPKVKGSRIVGALKGMPVGDSFLLRAILKIDLAPWSGIESETKTLRLAATVLSGRLPHTALTQASIDLVLL
jgi:hypothetical protein